MDIAFGALIGIISPILVYVLVRLVAPSARAALGGLRAGPRRAPQTRTIGIPVARVTAPQPHMGSEGMADWMQATLHATTFDPARTPPRRGVSPRVVATIDPPVVAQPAETVARAAGTCPACGYHNSPSARFCRGCRTDLGLEA